MVALPKEKPIRPKRPSRILRCLVNVICASELKKLHFSWTKKGMENFDKKQPCLYLMNHSSFLDLKIAEKIIPQRFNIVTTNDAFVGQRGLLTSLGCIPTAKFVTDVGIVRKIRYCFDKLGTSVLMFPEAGYSIDGTSTVLPYGLGKCVKLLKVPVVMITTRGAFLYEPLYNGLQKRQVNVTATMEYVFSPEQIAATSVEQINERISKCFSFDNFLYQQKMGEIVDEPFRADYLERVLYTCPHCHTEGQMEGKGTTLTCHACNKAYELTEQGYMKAHDSDTEIDHVPDWYRWERECVRKEIEEGKYLLDEEVDVIVYKGTKAVYRIGAGRLTHDASGFHLVAADGELDFFQPSKLNYSVVADFIWYEIGDVVGIGTNDTTYYCIPKNTKVPVAKIRLATEEIFKLLPNMRN